jgi:glycosyltransferase involved in cell wall biosynthesis
VKILIEATGTSEVGGGRTVLLGLLEALFVQDPTNSYLMLVTEHEPSFDRFGNVRQILLRERNRFVARLKLQAILPRLVRSEHIDVVHFTKNLGVFGLPCPVVITVHDLTILRWASSFPLPDRLYWRIIQPFSMKSAAAIITVSDDTRRDVNLFYGVPLERIIVAKNAIDEHYSSNPEEVALLRSRLKLPHRFILHVGSISPKKNLETLLRAFALVRSQDDSLGLVLVGREYRPHAADQLHLLAAELGIAECTRFTGAVSDSELRSFYSSASVLALTSVHEGFGLVLLEAMACRTPIVASRRGAVEEVVEGAAILVDDPTDPSKFASAMETILSDPGEAARLVRLGVEVVSRYSWASSASVCLGVYEMVTNARRVSQEHR